MAPSTRIVVLGAGFAGLESVFLLRMRLGGTAELTLVAPRDTFTFRPNAIYVPFGTDPDTLSTPLSKPFQRRAVAFVADAASAVDPGAHTVTLEGGRALGYDQLVIATGAQMRPEEIPGLAEHAATVWTPHSMLEVRGRFHEVAAAAARGERSDVLFLIPPNNKCAGPLYEVVLMFETWLRRQNARARTRITFSTFEHSYIQAFGPRLHGVVTREFEQREIDGHTDEQVVDVTAKEAHYVDGTSRRFDHLIAFPPYAAATRYGSLPSDERGFVQTTLATRQVTGEPDVYVPGDAGDFPVKQAFLAFLQADAAAEHIAAKTLGQRFTAPFDPVSLCIMEMLDKATFAQVPLDLTGDALRPVAVRAGADGGYRVGTGPVWRLGKQLLGKAVPRRFAAGEPFHAGTAWQAMALGLKGMSTVLAS